MNVASPRTECHHPSNVTASQMLLPPTLKCRRPSSFKLQVLLPPQLGLNRRYPSNVAALKFPCSLEYSRPSNIAAPPNVASAAPLNPPPLKRYHPLKCRRSSTLANMRFVIDVVAYLYFTHIFYSLLPGFGQAGNGIPFCDCPSVSRAPLAVVGYKLLKGSTIVQRSGIVDILFCSYK